MPAASLFTLAIQGSIICFETSPVGEPGLANLRTGSAARPAGGAAASPIATKSPTKSACFICAPFPVLQPARPARPDKGRGLACQRGKANLRAAFLPLDALSRHILGRDERSENGSAKNRRAKFRPG